jgi:hypothetical protein
LKKPQAEGWYGLLNGEIDPDRIRRFAGSNQLSQDHIAGSPHNRSLLNKYLDRFVVHLRDPRQATLSMIHYANLSSKKGGTPDDHFPQRPVDYFEWDLEKQIDRQLDLFLPLLVKFSEGWLESAEDPGFRPKILFTHQEELSRDGESVINRILEFYGIEHLALVDLDFPKPGEMHFRKGSTNEWQTVFTAKQCDKAASLIPVHLVKKFNWAH